MLLEALVGNADALRHQHAVTIVASFLQEVLHERHVTVVIGGQHVHDETIGILHVILQEVACHTIRSKNVGMTELGIVAALQIAPITRSRHVIAIRVLVNPTLGGHAVHSLESIEIGSDDVLVVRRPFLIKLLDLVLIRFAKTIALIIRTCLLYTSDAADE